MGVPGFFGGVPGFLLSVSGFWGCSGFSVVPECSVMFRCSGVPCSGLPESTTCLGIRQLFSLEMALNIHEEGFTISKTKLLGKK